MNVPGKPSPQPTLERRVAAPQVGEGGDEGREHKDEKVWRILIVDDNKDIVTVIRRILSGQGYDTLVATDGLEALDTARREMPDLILLDWMLPELDGLDVCRSLKGDPDTRGIMILLVTGRGSVANRVEGFNAGADDYIPKPFNHPELLARIRSALRLKQLTDELEERNRQLVASQNELVRTEKMATIGLLASGIAHEFNNIMAGISGYAQLAKSNPKFLPQLVEVALIQSERAMELTRSLSTYHQRTSDDAASSVRAVVTGALYLVKKELEDKGIQLVMQFERPLPDAAIKPGQLQEIILNLLINAIHAIHGRGVITIGGRQESPDEIILEVRDTGHGISKENLNRIFDPFFTTKGAFGGGRLEGTGLGLSVCYNIVESCGGQVTVESEVGEGTVFTIRLPTSKGSQRETVDAEEDGNSATPQAFSDGGKSLRILVVDDEDHIRRMLTEFFRNHEIVCCADGESAVEEYRKAPFDYVLLDICMRDSINGLETMERLKECDPEAKIILASGRLPEDIDEATFERVHGHAQKPYRIEDLRRLLGLTVEPQPELSAEA